MQLNRNVDMNNIDRYNVDRQKHRWIEMQLDSNIDICRRQTDVIQKEQTWMDRKVARY